MARRQGEGRKILRNTDPFLKEAGLADEVLDWVTESPHHQEMRHVVKLMQQACESLPLSTWRTMHKTRQVVDLGNGYLDDEFPSDDDRSRFLGFRV
jgi:hypothetical protein